MLSFQAVVVALQHLGADGSLDLLNHVYPLKLIGVAHGERADDVGLTPEVELLHIALSFCWFGHWFVPFRQALFLWRQAACLAHRRVSQAAGCPGRVIRLRLPPGRFLPAPGGALIRQGGGYNEKPVSKAKLPVEVSSG